MGLPRLGQADPTRVKKWTRPVLERPAGVADNPFDELRLGLRPEVVPLAEAVGFDGLPAERRPSSRKPDSVTIPPTRDGHGAAELEAVPQEGQVARTAWRTFSSIRPAAPPKARERQDADDAVDRDVRLAGETEEGGTGSGPGPP